MEKPVLNNPDIFPSDTVLADLLNKTYPQYTKVLEHLNKDLPKCSPEWNYYNDGKSWLLKVLSAKKTVCWISVHENRFRVTFYINSKNESLIQESPLSDTLKAHYAESEGKKIRGISAEITANSDLADFYTLVSIKKQAK